MSRQWSDGSRGPGSSWSRVNPGVTPIGYSGLFTEADVDAANTGLAEVQDPTTTITVAAWVKVASYPNTAHHTILGAFRVSSVLGYLFYVSGSGHGAEGRLTFAACENSDDYYWGQGTTQTLSTGTWYHVAATWTATGDVMKIYINGDSQTVIHLFTGVASPTTLTYSGLSRYSVGGMENSATRGFDGNIAYSAVWDSVLTAAEITYLYDTQAFDYSLDSGDYVSSADLVTWHKHTITDGYPTVIDASSNTYNLDNVNGSPVIEADGPT